MKQPKKPTLRQKQIMDENGLNWRTWNVVEEDKQTLTVLSKRSASRRVLQK